MKLYKLTMLTILAFTSTLTLKAQGYENPPEYPDHYKLGVDVYYGTPVFFQWFTTQAINLDLTEDYSNRQTRNGGPFGLRLEYRVDSDFGIGIDLGYNSISASAVRTVTTYDQNTNQTVTNKYTDEFSSYKIGAVITFNVRLYENEKFEASGVMGIGYGKRNFNFKSTDPNYNQDLASFGAELLSSTLPPVSFRVGFITRYFFTENVGINMGIGIGQGGLINGGLSFRM